MQKNKHQERVTKVNFWCQIIHKCKIRGQIDRKMHKKHAENTPVFFARFLEKEVWFVTGFVTGVW